MNIVILRGVLTRPAEPRELPSGDTIVAYEVRIARDDGPAESVPVVWSAPKGRGLLDAGRRGGDHRAGPRAASSAPAAPPRAAPRSSPTTWPGRADGRKVRRLLDAALAAASP